MSKIICDICGTRYPDTAEQCPICGHVSEGTENVVADVFDMDNVQGESRQKVSGGRFSKSNVKKRNAGTLQREEAPVEKAKPAQKPAKNPAKSSEKAPAKKTDDAATEEKPAAKKATAKKPATKKPVAEKPATPLVDSTVLANVSPETVAAVIGHKENSGFEKVQVGEKMPVHLL